MPWEEKVGDHLQRHRVQRYEAMKIGKTSIRDMNLPTMRLTRTRRGRCYRSSTVWGAIGAN